MRHNDKLLFVENLTSLSTSTEMREKTTEEMIVYGNITMLTELLIRKWLKREENSRDMGGIIPFSNHHKLSPTKLI